MTISVNQKAKIAAGYEQQIAYCTANDAPLTARICRAIMNVANEDTRTGARIMNWSGEVIPDALPLRSAAPFHALYQSGKAPALNVIYTGIEQDQDVINAVIDGVLRAHDDDIYPWLDTPPQTNEPGRCAALMGGLMTLSKRHNLPMEILEIGSSAGLNLNIHRYNSDLGGINVGPADSKIHIKPEWRGANTPPAVQPDILSTRGVDLFPMDCNDEQTRTRLLAYVWPEQTLRLGRTAAAIELAREFPVDLAAGDAADWVEAQLKTPQTDGTMWVLMHSVVWQYLPVTTQKRINDAMELAAKNAAPDKPLAWVALETNQALKRHELTIKSWPDHGEAQILGHAHAHGFWVEWL